MFTGLVEGLGTVTQVNPKGQDAELVIRPPWPVREAVIGESVATNGACLTVTRILGDACCLDASAETLSRTTLGKLKPGDQVNQERAMRLGDRFGGHMVTGHVDCVGSIARIERLGASKFVKVNIPAEHLALVVEKGSVCLDGISLTVNGVDDQGFDLNIIPHTFAATSLKLATQGDSVNIETDLIGKYVARLMSRNQDQKTREKGLSAEDLLRMGY
jgi:riboflavin synthase